MRAPRFYTAQVLEPGGDVELEADPSQHIARALRMPVGAALVLFDGRGGEYPAVIRAIGKRRVTAAVGEHRELERESPLAIHLGIAISRGERMDWVVQKATELGVRALSPLLSERTEVRLAAERADRKLGHWRRIAVSACEQCGRNRLPQINAPQGLDSWLQSANAERKLVLHHRAEEIGDHGPAPASVALLIGPEGGLDAAEIAAAEAAGFRSLRLGPRILRTETAPLAAVAILQARWGDMGGSR